MPPWEVYRESVPPLVQPLAIEGNLIEKEILKATGELSNHILTNGASKSLSRIKAEHPAYFTSLALYGGVLNLLGYYHFRLPVRRFILGLFDIKFEGAMWDRLDNLDLSGTNTNSKPNGLPGGIDTSGPGPSPGYGPLLSPVPVHSPVLSARADDRTVSTSLGAVAEDLSLEFLKLNNGS